MISAELFGTLASAVGAIAVWYAMRNLANAVGPDATLEQKTIDANDARLAAWAWLVCAVVALSSFAYADYADATPAPVPPAPGPGPNPGPQPGPQPNPPAPTPDTFSTRIRAAFKADGGTQGLAFVLGAMAQRLGEEIVARPDSFKDAADIGAKWEEYRGRIFQPMGRWCPKTNELLAAERENRGQTAGPITDHAAHAKLWSEFGKALLSYE